MRNVSVGYCLLVACSVFAMPHSPSSRLRRRRHELGRDHLRLRDGVRRARRLSDSPGGVGGLRRLARNLRSPGISWHCSGFGLHRVAGALTFLIIFVKWFVSRAMRVSKRNQKLCREQRLFFWHASRSASSKQLTLRAPSHS